MNSHPLTQPSLTYQVAAIYLDHINTRRFVNPGKNASLSQRVEAFVLRRLAAFPLVIMATLDLAFIAVMSIVTVLTFNAKGKHHFINLVSTLVLFPQAVSMFILGKLPEVNYVRQIGRQNGSIRDLFSSTHSPKKQKLILAQLKRHDEALLTKALSEIEPYHGIFLQSLISDINVPQLEPELLSFLVEKAQLTTTEAHAQRPYLNQLMQRFASIDQEGRPQGENASFSKYETVAKKLIDCGAAHFTRQVPRMFGFDWLLFGALNDLDRSVQAGWQSITEMLLKIDDSLDIKLSPEEKAARNNKLLCLAAYYQKPSLIKLMLDQGADPLAQFNGTCAWELALYSHHTENIQILLATGKVNPDSLLPLPDGDEDIGVEGIMVPLDFCLFDFSRITHSLDGPRLLRGYNQSSAKHEKRLETAKTLLHGGATFHTSKLEDERFRQTIPYILANNSEGLNRLKNEELDTNYHLRFKWLTRDILSKAEYINDLSTFLNDSLPKLTAEKEAIIKANAPRIHQAIPQEQIEAGFVEPLAKIISEYYYS